MASLNSDLRGLKHGENWNEHNLIHTEDWNKHQHVQWILDLGTQMSVNLVNSLKEIWNSNENEKIMDKLIEALIGPPLNKAGAAYTLPTTKEEKEKAEWRRNLISHLNLGLIGIDPGGNEDHPNFDPLMINTNPINTRSFIDNSSKSDPIEDDNDAKAKKQPDVRNTNTFSKTSILRALNDRLLGIPKPPPGQNILKAINEKNRDSYANWDKLEKAVKNHVHEYVDKNDGMGSTGPLLKPKTMTASDKTGQTDIANLDITRSLNFNNATEEENNITRTLLNQTLNYANLTTEQTQLKDLILSDPELTSRVFGPVLKEMLSPSVSDDDITGAVSSKLLNVAPLLRNRSNDAELDHGQHGHFHGKDPEDNHRKDHGHIHGQDHGDNHRQDHEEEHGYDHEGNLGDNLGKDGEVHGKDHHKVSSEYYAKICKT